MKFEAHKTFGRIILDRWGIDKDLVDWTLLPDQQYKTKTYIGYTLLHRWSLHGPDNIEPAIRQGIEAGFPYERKYRMYIRCLLMSHTYLDLFNFLVHPSWPYSKDFKYIPGHVWSALMLRTKDTPVGLEDVLVDMTYAHKTVTGLCITMLREYFRLPKEQGKYIQEIKQLYEKE